MNKYESNSKKIASEKPLVSVSVITYQHSEYINDCLDGILMQETNFSIEVLVHDDASTDGTEEIIREYESKFPNIVKPLYEKENQWEKGRKGSAVFNFPRAEGKYIALCEGDDYWTDPLKLQKQIDNLSKYPDCDLCFHPVKIYDGKNDKITTEVYGFHDTKIKLFKTTDIIEGGGSFCSTPSILFRKRLVPLIPMFINIGYGLHTLIPILASLRKGGLYLPEIMSIYRRNSKTSVMDKFNRAENNFIWINQSINLMEALNEHTEHKYDTAFRKRILNYKIKILTTNVSNKQKKKIYLEAKREMDFKSRVLYSRIFGSFCLYELVKPIYNLFKKWLKF